MAPAVLLCPPGTVQSLYRSKSASSSRAWPETRQVSSGRFRAPPALDWCKKAKSSGHAFPLEATFEIRRLAGLQSLARFGPSCQVFTAAVEEPATESEVSQVKSLTPEEQLPEGATTGEGIPKDSPPRDPREVVRKKYRLNPGRVREEPTVSMDALVPGAEFTGKVTTLQRFGAFVNFGAFTDGLVHISKLSSGFVHDVKDVVSVGQEVTVTVVDVDVAAGRIALSMVDKDAVREPRSQGGGTGGASRWQEGESGRPVNKGNIAGRGRQTKREDSKKITTKLKKGEEVKGTVKTVLRFGVYVDLPEGEEAFIRNADMPGGDNIAPTSSSLQPGQAITATVLRIDRGKILLTMKPVVDMASVNRNINKDEDYNAANPFQIAFRNMNFMIPAVEELASVATSSETTDEEGGEGFTFETSRSRTPATEEIIEEPALAASSSETTVAEGADGLTLESASSDTPVEEEIFEKAELVTSSPETTVEEGAEGLTLRSDTPAVEEPPLTASSSEVTTVQEGGEGLTLRPDAPAVEENVEEPSLVASNSEATKVEEGGEGLTLRSDTPAVEKPSLTASSSEATTVQEDGEGLTLRSDTPAVEESVEEPSLAASTSEATTVEDGGEGLTLRSDSPAVEESVEEPSLAASSSEATMVQEGGEGLTLRSDSPAVEESVEEPSPASSSSEVTTAEQGGEWKILEISKSDSTAVENSVGEPSLAASSSETSTVDKGDERLTLETLGSDNPAVEESAEEPAVAASRSETSTIEEGIEGLALETIGSQMPAVEDSIEERALTASSSEISIVEEGGGGLALETLQSGTPGVENSAHLGLVGSYIHDSRIGALIELRCEPAYISKEPKFKELVDDLGMQVVANQQVQFVSVNDVSKDIIEKEREIESQREDLANKPEAIRSRIVDGRVTKRLAELALLEQPFIRDDSVRVKDVIKKTAAAVGGNIHVQRFERFTLGEGLQKKNQDFAAEVAAQTKRKEDAKPATGEVSELAKKEDGASQVKVSASLVKELRDITGAGMMDCKKALGSCGNDLEQASEYLRKKGLAGAEKKASRLAAEGLIGTCISDGRIGVLIEVNCETDFVARGDRFKELVSDLAMQIAACPRVQVVSTVDVPAYILEKEKASTTGAEDPARSGELALLEQPYIKNEKVLIKDLIKETVAALGENIIVRRFTRFKVGEESEAQVIGLN